MDRSSIRYRSLLTDTLPYEVPIIFSNNKLHSSISIESADEKVAAALHMLRKRHNEYSIPYNYAIKKDEERTASLSIIHPAWQLWMSEFYEKHAASILNCCINESFSLRRPYDLASPFSEKLSDDQEARLKLGVAQIAQDEGEPDVSHMTSYFAYRRYTLLHKFIDSQEHMRLERRFRFERSLDISKCFYNIYTHSVAWAIKSKKFSKENAAKYSFEQSLDAIMQKCNYNETNGIVVGPEFSRVFAEIIFQKIDSNIEYRLSSGGLEITKDYDIRRYVDDYFVYSNELHILSYVEKIIRECLEEYKLFVNEEKVKCLNRPFVSSLSMARQEAHTSLRSIRGLLQEIKTETEKKNISNKIRLIKLTILELRLIIKKYKIGFESITGWVFARLRRLVRISLSWARETADPEKKVAFVDAAIAMLESAFHICSLDFRVRTTYSLSQLCLIFHENLGIFSPEQVDEFHHIITEEILGILRSAYARKIVGINVSDSVESLNLMICGAHFVGVEFVRSSLFREIVQNLIGSEKIGYFTYVSIKYCLLKDPIECAGLLDQLNSTINGRLQSATFNPKISSEDYMLLCDYISAPDIDSAKKRQAFIHVFGGDMSKATAAALPPHVGFVDWGGLSVKHLLKRKELRPVYAWG